MPVADVPPVPTAQAPCPLYAQAHHRVDHPLVLADGTTLVARDPYAGLLPRNRLEFQYSLTGAKGALAKVAKVSWALDGRTVRTDDRAPYAWLGVSGSDRRMPAGDHQITVTVTPRSGAQASTSFATRATDCQPASAFVDIAGRHGATSLSAASAFEGGPGPGLMAATFRATNVRVRRPRSARGRVVGSLVLGPADRPGHAHTITLRLPRHGSLLARRGPLRVVLLGRGRDLLRVSGLAQGTKTVTVTLAGVGRGLITPVRCTTAIRTEAALATYAGRIAVGAGTERFAPGGCR